MKTIIRMAAIILLTLVIEECAFSQKIVTHLTSVKVEAEFLLVTSIQKKHHNLPEILSRYNLVKKESEIIINQLIADMGSKNRLRPYREADNLLKSEITSLNLQLDTLKSETKQPQPVKVAPEEIVGVIQAIYTLGSGIVKDINEVKGKKIEKVISLLNELKLDKVTIEQLSTK